jgi:hypothetical protein
MRVGGYATAGHRELLLERFQRSQSTGYGCYEGTRNPLHLARCYASLLDSGKFESRADLAPYLGVSRARVTQVLRRPNNP